MLHDVTIDNQTVNIHAGSIPSYLDCPT